MSKSREPASKLLADVFDEIIGRPGNKHSQASVAREIGCNPSTLRTWFKRKAFPRNEAEAIAAALGMSRTELDGYGPENFTKPTGRKPTATKDITTFPNAVEELEQLCSCSYSRRSPEADREINDAVRTLLDTLGEKCFWAATTQTLWPLMLNPPSPASFGQGIYGAIDRGMCLALVAPTSQYLSEITSCYRLRRGITPYHRFVEHYNRFKQGYVDHLGGESALQRADTKIQMFEVSDFLVTPAHTVVTAFGQATATGNPKSRILLESPTDSESGLLLAAYNKTHDEIATAYLDHVIGESPRSEEWHEGVRAAGILTLSDPAAAIAAREQFVKMISRARRGTNVRD